MTCHEQVHAVTTGHDHQSLENVCSAMHALTATDCTVCLQVAGQQGAYVARMINRGYTMGVGGLDQAPPIKVAADALGKVSSRHRGWGWLTACYGMHDMICACRAGRSWHA